MRWTRDADGLRGVWSMSDHGSRAALHFEVELNALVERFRHEYELTYVEAVGVLEVVKLGVAVELRNEEEDDDEDV